jgi:hypothetical protein
VSEQVAVRQAERERVRRAVGKAGERDPRPVDGDLAGHRLEGAVDERHVGAESPVNGVPSLTARIRGKQDVSRGLATVSIGTEPIAGAPACAVEKDEQRERFARGVRRWNVKQSISKTRRA